MVPEVPAVMVHVLLGHSEPGPRLQRNIYGLRAAMGRVRQRLWHTVPESTDALWDAVGEALERATRPSHGSRTLCLQCGSVGPCLPTRPNCPRDDLHRFPIALHTPDQLVALRGAIVAELPQLSLVVQPLPDVTLAQAYLILELWTTAFQQRGHGLAPHLLMSPPIWTGTVVLALLTPYNDPAVRPAGGVGALVLSVQSGLPTAERRSLEAINRSWAATTWLSFDVCPHYDVPRLQRAVQITPLVAPDAE